MSPEYREEAQKAFGIEDTKLETKEYLILMGQSQNKNLMHLKK